MKNIAIPLMALMLASNTFAFPLYTQYKTSHKKLDARPHNIELSDFSGTWVGCYGPEDSYTLKITQNHEQISLIFNYATFTFDINALSSESTGSANRRAVAIHHADVLSSNEIRLDYEEVGEYGSSEETKIVETEMHISLIKLDDMLEVRANYPNGGTCLLRKEG